MSSTDHLGRFVVKWSACFPSIATILVEILLKPTFFSKMCIIKEQKESKRIRDWSVFSKKKKPEKASDDLHGGGVFSQGRRLFDVIFEDVVEVDGLGGGQVLANLENLDSSGIDDARILEALTPLFKFRVFDGNIFSLAGIFVNF